MKTTTSFIFNSVSVIFSSTFTGLCLKLAVILTSFLASLFVYSTVVNDPYLGANLSELYSTNKTLYISVASLIIVLTALQTYIAFSVVMIFTKLDLSTPFVQTLPWLFLKISPLAIGAGILALLANSYSRWIMKKGIDVPMEWGGFEMLFFAGIIYIIALVFKKGLDLQSEN